MADQKISELPLNSSINGTENVATERGGSNYRSSLQNIKDYVLAEVPTSGVQTVTGSSVDNTDLKNPVVKALPLVLNEDTVVDNNGNTFGITGGLQLGGRLTFEDPITELYESVLYQTNGFIHLRALPTIDSVAIKSSTQQNRGVFELAESSVQYNREDSGNLVVTKITADVNGSTITSYNPLTGGIGTDNSELIIAYSQSTISSHIGNGIKFVSTSDNSALDWFVDVLNIPSIEMVITNTSKRNKLLPLTTSGDLPDDIDGKTITLDSATNETLTFTTTTFSSVGDIAQVSSIGVGFPFLDVGTGVVFNKSDSDSVASLESNKKGFMRLEDVGGNVVIDLY